MILCKDHLLTIVIDPWDAELFLVLHMHMSLSIAKSYLELGALQTTINYMYIWYIICVYKPFSCVWKSCTRKAIVSIIIMRESLVQESWNNNYSKAVLGILHCDVLYIYIPASYSLLITYLEGSSAMLAPEAYFFFFFFFFLGGGGGLMVLEHPPKSSSNSYLYSKQTSVTWDMATLFHSRQVASYL